MQRVMTGVGAVVIALSAGMAQAGIGGLPNGLDFEVQFNGGAIWKLSENLGAVQSVTQDPVTGNWVIEAGGTVNDSTWDIDLTVSPVDPAALGPGIASISSAFTVTNNNAATQRFTVTAVQAAVVAPAFTEILGSHSGNVGDNPAFGDGATLAAFTGASMYAAQIDGATVQTRFNDPFSSVAVPFLTNAYGPGNYGWIGGQPAVTTDIRIINDFTLTGFDNAGMTSTFVVRVPSPGTMALIAVSGLVALRRRRG